MSVPGGGVVRVDAFAGRMVASRSGAPALDGSLPMRAACCSFAVRLVWIHGSVAQKP